MYHHCLPLVLNDMATTSDLISTSQTYERQIIGFVLLNTNAELASGMKIRILKPYYELIFHSRINFPLSGHLGAVYIEQPRRSVVRKLVYVMHPVKAQTYREFTFTQIPTLPFRVSARRVPGWLQNYSPVIHHVTLSLGTLAFSEGK